MHKRIQTDIETKVLYNFAYLPNFVRRHMKLCFDWGETWISTISADLYIYLPLNKCLADKICYELEKSITVLPSIFFQINL